MAAGIDWRDDASLPSRVFSWRTWTLAITLLAVVMAGITVIAVDSLSDVNVDLCRLHEAREGVDGLEKMDLPAVGEKPLVGWRPSANVRVHFVATEDAPHGAVVNITRCGGSGRDKVDVTINK